ncbi:hypothetical protein [Myxococcus hansupus]|uniref:hypothetical protein n=1 Tax=Pseudomyxococcus hansupus TaxID=1297742 RepID=UPI000676B0AB|nr:hypothetical protein [Myxococcus hansupus]
MSPRLISSKPDCTSSLERLRTELAQTVAWCEARARDQAPRESLRGLPDPVDIEAWGRLGLSPANLVWATQGVRYKTLKGSRLEVPAIEWGTLPGRLLVFFPDEEAADGGAEAQTGGYFDVHNTPPWDTWVGYFDDLHETPTGPMIRSYLLAYVPAVFVPHVGRGISVDPEECIQWLEDSDTALATLVKQLVP